jgi:hypothetical protein
MTQQKANPRTLHHSPLATFTPAGAASQQLLLAKLAAQTDL